MAHSLNWRKSSYSGGTNAECVEVAAAADSAHGAQVLVRDTRDRAGSTLRFAPAQWYAFLAALRAAGPRA